MSAKKKKHSVSPRVNQDQSEHQDLKERMEKGYREMRETECEMTPSTAENISFNIFPSSSFPCLFRETTEMLDPGDSQVNQ